MLRRQFNILFGTLRKRPAGWLALVGQLAAVFGLPLPAVSAKDLSSPFPCQQRQCGCMRAADCWSHCCCFSARERLAWAQEHQAEVPDSLVEQARSEGQEPGSCCVIKKTKLSRPGSKSLQHALGFMARQCHGHDTPWGSGDPAPLPARAVSWCFDDNPGTWCPSLSWDSPFVSHVPPVPPPRA